MSILAIPSTVPQWQQLAIYAVGIALLIMIRALDRGVGEVVATLKSQGLDDNTLVIFTNDNGGAWYAGLPTINKPYRGWKGTFFEGGIRVPMFVRWPGTIRAGQKISMPTMHVDVLPTLAAAAGAPLPRDRVVDGMNLLPPMTGKATPPARRVFFWRSGTYEAIREIGRASCRERV